MGFLVRVGDGRQCLDGEDSMRQENGDAEQMGRVLWPSRREGLSCTREG